MKVNKVVWQFLGWFVIIGTLCLALIIFLECIHKNRFREALYSITLFAMVAFMLTFAIIKTDSFKALYKWLFLVPVITTMIIGPLLITYQAHDTYERKSESKFLSYELFGDELTISLKYLDGRMYYKFRSDFETPVTYNNKTYTVSLKDEYLFTLKEIEMDNVTTHSKGEGTKKTGLSQNGNIYMGIETYSNIWNLTASVR